MFDGSDISLAYGSYEEPELPVKHQPQNHTQPPPPLPQSQPIPPPQLHTQSQQPLYQPSDAMYMNSYPLRPPQQQQQYKYTENFIDKFISKRYDVLKVVSFALIIVFAISIDRFSTFYLTYYIGVTELSSTQEMLIRLGYPIVVLIIIWLLKTF